jgi:hypothetical protein
MLGTTNHVLSFFRPKKSELERNWDNRRVPFDEVVPFLARLSHPTDWSVF